MALDPHTKPTCPTCGVEFTGFKRFADGRPPTFKPCGHEITEAQLQEILAWESARRQVDRGDGLSL